MSVEPVRCFLCAAHNRQLLSPRAVPVTWQSAIVRGRVCIKFHATRKKLLGANPVPSTMRGDGLCERACMAHKAVVQR
jgi:hypothetical protein